MLPILPKVWPTCRTGLLLSAVFAAPLRSLHGHDFTDWFSVGVTAAAAGQYQSFGGALTPDDLGRGAAPLQLEFSLHPDDCNEFFAKLGFAGGNGLNGVSPFALAPWAADLEDDVRDINGRGRDFLLSAYYRHALEIGEHEFTFNIGILDSTDFFDQNEYANDEYTQFMNEVFVNSGSYSLPSYDYGLALQWASGPWSVNALAMSVGENDDGNDFLFWGLQAAYSVENRLGRGNYRLIMVGTDSAFRDPTATILRSRFVVGMSCDQELTEHIGCFLRCAWQTHDALIDYHELYSGGFNFSGAAWGRESDNVGIGYAYLPGGHTDIDHTHALEIYYRLGLADCCALTADIQYMDDSIRGAPGTNGWIGGLRLVFSF